MADIKGGEVFYEITAKTGAGFESNIQKAEKSMQGIEKSANSANKSVNDLGKSGQQGFKGLITQANALKLAVGGAVVAGLKALTTAIGGVAREGALLLQTEVSFKQLTNRIGINAEETLKALQKAANGTVANKEIMISANRAIVFEIAKSTEDLVTLFNTASVLGRDMGISTEQAFSDLVTGLGRSSPLILDNLGLIIKAEDEYIKYAKTLGKTAEQLTNAERKQAIVNAALEAGRRKLAEVGGNQENYVDKFEKMDVSMKNFKANIGKSLLVPLAGVFDSLTQTGNMANENSEAFDNFSRVLYGFAQFAAGTIKVGILPLFRSLQAGFYTVKNGASLFYAFAKDVQATFESIKKPIANFAGGLKDIFSGDFEAGIAKMKEGFTGVKLETTNTSKAFAQFQSDNNKVAKGITNDFTSIATSFGNVFSKESYDNVKKTIEAGLAVKKNTEGLKQATDDLQQTDKKAKKEKEDLAKKTDDYRQKLVDTTNEVKKLAKSLNDDLGEAYKKFGTTLQETFDETQTKLAEIVVDAEQKKKELQAKIALGGDVQEAQKELADVQKILDARVGYETRALQQVADVKKRLQDAGLDPDALNLDGLVTTNSLEQRLIEERKNATLDEFTLFEKQQNEKLIKLTETFISETTILKAKVDAQKGFEAELTTFLQSENSKRLTSIELFAQQATAKYGDIANSLRDVISLQNQVSALTAPTSLPQFHNGGYVSSTGQVHAGEYVIPANIVASNSSLISALESGRTQNNTITINNNNANSSDPSSWIQSMLWRLNR